MDNRLSVLMFIAMIGYVIFCSVKCRQVSSSEDNKNSNKYFGIVVVGMLLGFVLGIFSSPTLTKIIFTENFIKIHSNPDVGLFSFYILITLALMVVLAIVPIIVYGFFTKSDQKTN